MASEKAREGSECMGVKDEAGGRKRRTRIEKSEWSKIEKSEWKKQKHRGSVLTDKRIRERLEADRGVE